MGKVALVHINEDKKGFFKKTFLFLPSEKWELPYIQNKIKKEKLINSI